MKEERKKEKKVKENFATNSIKKKINKKYPKIVLHEVIHHFLVALVTKLSYLLLESQVIMLMIKSSTQYFQK